MADERDVTPPRADLRSALSRLTDAALTLLRTRGELAALDFAEERARAKRSALTLAVAVLLAAFALGGIGAWVVVYFWDAGRLTAIALVTLAYALLAFVLWRVDCARNAAAAPPFAATLAEFEKDREWLARQARPGPPA
jgi:uncharacterized membrane protein YqjE